MSINGITLLTGSTGITVTGGSAVVMKDDGATIPNGIHVVDTSVTMLATRPHSTFKSKAASYVNGMAIKGKREITHVRPKLLADDTVAYPLVRISFEIDPEFTAAELLELRQQAIQHIADAELDDFYKYGTVHV
jgi:hypothetical protein